ncbi:MAG TPA: glycerate kinase [Bryobacteraceae bacterium]|nr:glycerate kinase [Bryobacteraceae bacterium]
MSQNHALRIFRSALKAADPERAVHRYVKLDGKTLIVGRRRYSLSNFDRIQVVGAGKASAAMARAVERTLGKRLAGGFVNVPHGSQVRTRKVELNESGHPIPDERGLSGARRIAEIAGAATERDLLICVISGGASALMPDPVPPVTLADTQETTRQLLACGANIHELNAVRKHISVLKGGQLAKLAWPATVVALILSDVVGDDLDVIGSGPTVPDGSTFEDARGIFEKYAIRPPESVRERVGVGVQETPKAGDPSLARVQNLIVGSNRLAIDAAAEEARALGYRTIVLSTFIEGETRDVASMHAAIVKEILSSGRPLRPPACILSGGETTVTIRGKGLGGRNQEFVLAAAIALEGFGPFTVFSGGTDGADGPTDAAGAVANEDSIARARELGLDPRRFLADNDSYHFFEALGGLVKTGPSGTNVMDVRVFLVPSSAAL